MSAHSTTKSFAWSFLEQGGSKLIQMVVQIILARILSPDAFGVLAILLVVTQITDSVAQSGFGMGLIQKSDADALSYTTAWWFSLALAAVMYVIVFVSAPVVATMYSMDGLDTYLRVLGLIVFTNSANSIQRSYLQRSMDFRSIFRASTVSAVLSGLVGIGLALSGAGVWALIAQSLSQSVFTCITMWLQVNWKPSLSFDRRQARELFSYGWEICVTAILNVFYQGISELILGMTSSAEQLGFYSQGRKYPAAVIAVMNNSIANVLFPSFAEVQSDRVALTRRIKDALSLGTFIVVPTSFLFAVTAEPLVEILLTDKWIACVPIFQLTCVSNAFLIMQLVNLRAYMALGDSALYLRLQIIKVLGGGAVIWVTAALSHDIYLTAWATCIVQIASVLFVDVPPAKRMHGYGALAQVRDLLPTFALAAASSAAAATVGMAQLNACTELLLQCVSFCAVFLTGARLLRFPQLEKAVSIVRGALGR